MRTPLDDLLRQRGRGSAVVLAREAGVSYVYLTQIRNGKRRPSLPVALRLAELTGLPVESFNQTQDPPCPPTTG